MGTKYLLAPASTCSRLLRGVVGVYAEELTVKFGPLIKFLKSCCGDSQLNADSKIEGIDMGNSSPFNPQSPLSQITANLFIYILIIARVILAIVAFGLVYSIVRFRSRDDEGEPPQIL